MDYDDGIQPSKHGENQTVCESENLPQHEVIGRHCWLVNAIDQGKELRSLVEATGGCRFSSVLVTW